MLHDYESIFIARSSLSEEDVAGLTEKVKAIIEKNGGQVIRTENWGKKKLAYEVKKEKKGVYVMFHIKGPGALVSELERNLNIQDGIIKFMTVKLDMKAEEAKIQRAGRLVEAQREKALEPISEKEA
ncbi:MAG TPA: 30S ribosomal protein S6 [Nitrospiria bacterium]|nr:30S ribosomal protein S6 [Nitrospiria bacterium]